MLDFKELKKQTINRMRKKNCPNLQSNLSKAIFAWGILK